MLPSAKSPWRVFERITFNAKSYDEALNIISEYVDPVENYEESFQMKGFEWIGEEGEKKRWQNHKEYL